MAKALPSVFITYNPKSDFERTLAFRLHTLGAVHGYRVSLPDRKPGTTKSTPETRLRIQSSDYFILFSTSKLSSTIEEEISIAWETLHDKSKIIIIYDGTKNLKGTEHCTEILVDSNHMTLEEITSIVIQKLKPLGYTIVPKSKNNIKTKTNKNGDDNVLAGLLIAGLGLLLLGALLEDSK